MELEEVEVEVELELELPAVESTTLLSSSDPCNSNTKVALASKFKNIFADAASSRAEIPRLILGIRCAVKFPVAVTSGDRERDNAI